MPWHVHIEDLALVCMKSMEANAKLGSRLCNRGLLDMTSDHMIGAQSQLLSYPRALPCSPVLASLTSRCNCSRHCSARVEPPHQIFE